MRKLVAIVLCALFATQIYAGNKFELTSKENETLKAIIAVSVVDPKEVSIILQAGAGSSKARADEISKRLQLTRGKSTIPVTEESKAQAKKIIEQAHVALDAQKKYANIVAIENSSVGKSMTIEGHQFGPALVKAGMLTDIHRATHALKSKIGSEAYQELSDNAQREIDSSASQLLTGGDRDALAGFLMLQAGDPVAAAEIFNRAVSPTSIRFDR